MNLRRFIIAAIIIANLSAPAALAIAVPQTTLQSAVYVICGDRQGSGVITNAVDGYVLTVGHVVLGEKGGPAPDRCELGFVGQGLKPESYYWATVEHAVLDFKKDLDFAVLKIGDRVSGPEAGFQALKINEFAAAGDEAAVFGFPAGGDLAISIGSITGYGRGIGQTTAIINQGSSGSPVVDGAGNVVGLATRQRLSVNSTTGAETVAAYEFGDVLPLIAWLETFGPGTADRYLAHADPVRYHQAPYQIRTESPGCLYLVRTELSPTVYCLMADQHRLVFPNVATYQSWYPDFSGVLMASLGDIARYTLMGNIDMRAGSLVKIATDPKVYLVTDSIGTLRWVQTEERAVQLFGPDWSHKVVDVPDSFFFNYSIAAPIP